MRINDVVVGLAAGVGIDLSPDGKTALYVEWSIGELSRVDVQTGTVVPIKTGLSYPEDVEVDWQANEIFVSERTGNVIRIRPRREVVTIARLDGAPHQLDLKKDGGDRFLYTICYDSGCLWRIDANTGTTKLIAKGLGHPVGLVVDGAQKAAYVTEQDRRSLTRVELANGAISRLCSGLVSPFYLAWGKDEHSLFCVQRDPANSLMLIRLGSPPTTTTVASGLAWRPSGVAPNADKGRIYICADREMEVICLGECPTIIRPRPPFTVHSIQFNYRNSAALPLKNHVNGAAVSVPEYVRNVRNGPAAYIAKALPRIRVVLKRNPGFIGGAYAIGAMGGLGGVRRKTVTPVFNTLGFSNPIDFELMWPLPAVVDKPFVKLDWYARKSTGLSIPTLLGSTGHQLYLVMARPTEPWVTETPWIAALDIACGWASGAGTIDAAAARITERYYHCGMVRYDDVSGATFYGVTTYALSEMIERLNGGLGLGQKVNCTDSANTVSTLANLLGCDLWQCRMGSYFDLNPILALGAPSGSPWPPWSGFSYHEVPWGGAGTVLDRVFDGCLMVDGDSDPTAAPQTWVLPVNMIFGDCTTMNYRLRLTPPGPDGCDRCLPLGTCRRRPIN